MWKSIYDSALESLTVKWSTFISSSNDTSFAQQLRGLFLYDLYSFAGWTLLGATGVFCFLYYYVLAKRPGYYFKMKYWFLFMFLSALFVFAITYYLGASEIKRFASLEPPSFVFNLAIINSIYSIILFLILSLCIKWWSPAKTTPRFYPY